MSLAISLAVIMSTVIKKEKYFSIYFLKFCNGLFNVIKISFFFYLEKFMLTIILYKWI